MTAALLYSGGLTALQKQRCYSRSSLFYWLCPNNKTLTQERREIKRSEQYSKIRSKKLCYASSSHEGELAFYFLWGPKQKTRTCTLITVLGSSCFMGEGKNIC